MTAGGIRPKIVDADVYHVCVKPVTPGFAKACFNLQEEECRPLSRPHRLTALGMSATLKTSWMNSI